MGIFKDDRFDYFEDERQKLWARATALEGQSHNTQEQLQTIQEQMRLLEVTLSKKTSDYESEAIEAAENAVKYVTGIKEAMERVNEYLTEASTRLQEINSVSDFVAKIQPEIKGHYESTELTKSDIVQVLTDVQSLHAVVTAKATELDSIYSNHAGYVERVSKLEELYTNSNELNTKTEQSYKSVLGLSEEIKKLHRNIVGYLDKDDKGDEVRVSGLKDKLETEYADLESKTTKLLQRVADIEIHSESQYSVYKQAKEDEIKTTLKNWELEHDAIVQKLKDLLPEALTKGLSAAYHEKKRDEISASKWLNLKFIVGIMGMIVVSLIPFTVSIYFMKTGEKTLNQVINDIPKLVLAILPLYIPVLWLAYSANKGLNLSKRLIEEYTHKEVLSKTFEGLSTQIENIKDQEISSELRAKLLYNILEVNSENPGKLITDYNKSDHPLMDILDKSVKLSSTIDKIGDIPGIAKVVKMLEKKNKHKLDEKRKHVEAGLDAVSEQDEEDSEGEDEGEGKDSAKGK